MDVICLGLMIYDVLVKPVTKESLDREHNRVDFVKTSTGGDAFNVANALARIGLKSALIGKIGDDRAGKVLLDVAAENGVDTKSVIISQKYGTATSVLLVHPDAQRSSLYYAGANDDFREEDIDFEKIKSAKILAIGSTIVLRGLDGEGMTRLLKRTKEANVTTVIDVKGDLNQGNMDLLKSYLPYTDIFVPNYKEASGLTGKSNPDEIATVFMEYGVKTVVIKMGIEGCYIRTKDEELVVPAFKVDAVDTTGAGDSFVSGFITGYSKGWSLYECGRFANAVGALSVQQAGATEGIKSMEETLDFIKLQDKK